MKYFITIIFLLFSTLTIAQKQNNNWCFGNKAGISFNSGTPTGFSSDINCGEGSATVSNRNTGALLFYTDGVRVWNRTHNIMPNGNGIGNDLLSSSLQGTVIVPFLNDSNKYYVFSLEPESLPDGALFYSVVDMTLNGGLGDVVATQKKVKLGQDFVEGMYAAATCGGYWLLLSSSVKNEIIAYRITEGGVDTTPVVSQMPYPHITTVYGCIKLSPDKKKILYASYTSLPVNGRNEAIAALHDFDETTGKISNGKMLVSPSTNATYYGAEFSSDGSKAYISDLRQGLFQFDLSLPDSLIPSSKATVYQNPVGRVASLLQIGPDDNIYVSIDGLNSVDRISNANAAFPACTYTQSAVTLSPGATALKSFPPQVNYTVPKTIGIGNDTTICFGFPMVVNAAIPGESPTYLWQDGSTADTLLVADAGAYSVTAYWGFCIAKDTIVVAVNDSAYFTLGNDTLLCDGTIYPLYLPFSADTFAWSTGVKDSLLAVSQPGIYILQVERAGCTYADSVSITYAQTTINIGNDTLVCNGEEFTIGDTSILESNYLWNTGETTEKISINKAGEYILTIENRCGMFKDTAYASYKVCDCKAFLPSAFTPNNDGRNDKMGPVLNCKATSYEFIIINRFGEVVFRTTDLKEKWDGSYKGRPADVGTYYYMMKIKNTSGTDEFQKGDVVLMR